MKNKKLNTAIFMVVATIVNVLLMLFFLFVGFILLAKFGTGDDSNSQVIWTMVIFVAAMLLSWATYGFMVKVYSKHVNLDENFAAISFKRKKKQKKQSQENSGSGSGASVKG